VRVDGYAPIRDYAAIGDGATVALVALDGSIDWLCLPRHDSEPVCAALLDAEQGGRFSLAPVEPFEAERRYAPDSNVLETTFTTSAGSVRVTDALALADGGTLPWRELARRVEGLSGSVALRWEFRASAHITPAIYSTRDGTTVLRCGDRQIAILAWDAGDGDFEVRPGDKAHIALVATDPGPHPFPCRNEIEARVGATVETWRRWVGQHTYEGPWSEAVERSLLALKLLICTDTGAIVAAPTTSLPERIGGDRNYDYRYAWPRDSCWTIAALISLGFREQAQDSFAWVLEAIRGTRPEVASVYELDGGVLHRCDERDWPGYRGSRPVRVGNWAGSQLQLGGYADLLDTAVAYIAVGNLLDSDTSRLLADVVDHVCEIWELDDSGIWERREPRQFTQSKIACRTALRRAIELAEAGRLPRGSCSRWRRELDRVEAFVEERCWSKERRSYVQSAGSASLDAAELLCARRDYAEVGRERVASTVDAIRRELCRGPLVYRDSGSEESEGAFVACSFWLVEALARLDRVDEACELMDETLAFANDVGLYAEEIEPSSGDFLGNFPQGLSHLSLIGAAVAVDQASRG
jgi:GH15 family glucan-1,4-alpha-glucosidase